MKLTFLGTKGYIEPRNERHAMHSSLAVSYRGRKVMIDCGSGIVNGENEGVLEQIREFARQREADVDVAYDGMEVVLR